MKSFRINLLLTTLLIIVHTILYAQNEKDSVVPVSIYGNSYEYPQVLDEDSGVIQKSGITGWQNEATRIRLFFYPQQPGNLSVSLKLRSASGSASLKIRLDSGNRSFVVKAKKTNDFLTVPAGVFHIGDSRYHSIEISGLHRSGKSFPEIESIFFSGPAAAGLKFNTSEYKGAPSVHLRYPVPANLPISWFYTEISVPQGINAQNAYYETNGFADGYMGIQINSPTERRFIFSIWSNFNTDNPKEIPAEYAVKLIKKGKDVFSGDFGNEGSGGHSHLVFPWKNTTTYKLLVGAKAAGDHTIFTGYYFDPELNAWKLIAQWDKSKTGGALLSNLYAFVENFGPNGNDFFKADYGNQWVYSLSGQWLEITEAHVTTTASPTKHPRYDYGAGVENNWFYMFSGGFSQLYNLSPDRRIERRPNGKHPDIDFAQLPEN